MLLWCLKSIFNHFVSECSHRATFHHWDWQHRKAGSCEHSSAWGSKPSQFTYSHMTRPDAPYPWSSPSVRVTRDRKLECSHKLVSWLSCCKHSMMQDRQSYRKKPFLHHFFSSWKVSACVAAQDCCQCGVSCNKVKLYYLDILFIILCKIVVIITLHSSSTKHNPVQIHNKVGINIMYKHLQIIKQLRNKVCLIFEC